MHKILILTIFVTTTFIFNNAYFYNPKRFKNVDLTQINTDFTYNESNLINNTLAGLPYQGQIYTGYLTVNQTSGSKIFYMLYSAGGNLKNSTINNTNPLILWMQGGPGCSDWTGNFFELGPMTLINNSGNATAILQNITWNDEYNILFVDQPVGVGFSPSGGENMASSTQAANHMQTFLMRFFEIYNSLSTNDFYIFGESYAGHYIPSLAALLVSNYAYNNIKLTGVGVGDGITNAFVQVATYSDYVYTTGLIDEIGRNQMSLLELKAQIHILNEDYEEASAIFDIITGSISIFSDIDIYNYRVYYGSDGETESPLSQWLSYNSTIQSLNLDPNVDFEDCNGQMYHDFYNDITLSYADNYSYLLTQSIYPVKLMLYNGQNDIIINTPGSLNWINQIEWPGNTAWRESPRITWTALNGSILGEYKHYGQFTFAEVKDSGHMVPGDQPASARDLVRRLINDDWN